jgi:FMN phosphatase YigB (HAD superfamily)
MKFIFDFDDVLFNTKDLKRWMYTSLNNVGISFNVAEAYYEKIRGGEFSLKNYLSELVLEQKIDVNQVYEEIMAKCPDFVNTELVNIIRKIGKENSYLVTYGEKEFNRAKVERSGLAPLFSEIHIVQGSKKEIIRDICERNKTEKIIFVDDKIKFIEDIDMAKCPNLKTILFNEQGLKKVIAEINS